jgi:hypothetical protein
MKHQLTPYRVLAFGTRKHRKKTVGYGFDVWNPELTDHWAHAGRLNGSGSFLWLGLRDAKNAVGRAFLDPNIHQVQIRTNQDKQIAIFYRGPHVTKRAIQMRLAA